MEKLVVSEKNEQNKRLRRSFAVIGLLLCGASSTMALPGDASNIDDYDWQEQRLLQPSASQLRQEKRGQVFIYDGLEYGQVQQVMNEQFDRIQNMMFTRIQHLPPTGSGPAEVEDDGCE
jgi:hypothetical protein